jgi:chaperonin cofactor prefoldin
MPKKVTIEQLAVMVQKGFQETATKDVHALEERMGRMEGRMHNIEERMGRMEKKLDTIQNEILEQHAHRLDLLEDDMRRIKDALPV